EYDPRSRVAPGALVVRAAVADAGQRPFDGVVAHAGARFMNGEDAAHRYAPRARRWSCIDISRLRMTCSEEIDRQPAVDPRIGMDAVGTRSRRRNDGLPE